MSLTSTNFGAYSTRNELARGRRKALVSLAVAVAAISLAVLASRTVHDGRLVAVYLVAGGMHFVSCLAASLRWSRTPDFDAVD